MADNNYSFIDVAAWDGVRDLVLSGQPVAVFSGDLEELIWTNGAAASLFGYASISEFENDGPAGIAVALRQIEGAARRLSENGQVRTLLRIASGAHSRLLPADIRKVTGPQGQTYVCVAVEGADTDIDETARAEIAIAGLDMEGAAAAIVDGDGQAIAENPNYRELQIGKDQVTPLVRSLTGDSDRLVKQIVTIAPARQAAIAIALLSQEPHRHLVVAVPAPVSENAVAPEETDQTVASPTPATEPEPEEPVAAVVTGHEALEAVPGSLLDVEAAADEQPPEELTRKSTGQEPAAGVTEAEPRGFEADFNPHGGPVRFVWKTDASGRFQGISAEFASAVGPAAADIVGRTFQEVAEAFALDPSGEIAASLDRRDTWSGKSVLWPVQGTARRVPVDLAALPSYNRDREFEGYRGFGIARIGEARNDPDGFGLSLGQASPDGVTPEAEAITPPAAEPPVETDEEAPALDTSPELPDEAADPFEGEVPALQNIAPVPQRRETDKVINLNAKRRTRVSNEGLNPSEQAAFRRIGDALGWARIDQGVDGDEDTTDANGSHAAEAPETPVTEPSEHEETVPVEADAVERADDRDLTSETGVDEPDASKQSVNETADETNNDVATTSHSRLTPEFVESLPVPALIHRNGEALFANAAFCRLTGYGSAGELDEAGGIAALFAEPDGENGDLTVVTTAGDYLRVRAHMQSVRWQGAAALMFALEELGEAGDADAAETADNWDLLQLSDATELRAILDTATDGVVLLTLDGVIRSINGSAAALFGYSKDEIVGKNFTTLFAVESQAAAVDYVQGLANNGVASVLNEGLEVLGREKNGGFLPLFMTIGKLEKLDGFCAVVRDITAWKQTEQALLDAQQEAESASSHKTEFLAKISHEIRTPLNAIIGFSELMAEERFGPIGNDRYKSYLADINKSGKYVLELVNDLLDISKIEAGKQDLEFDSVALNEAVLESVSMIQPQANRNRVIIRSSLDEDLPEVVADARSLKQIVLNLLSNSVRFTHSGGQVIINTSYNARGEVVLRIKDTGIGMSAKEIETALQPFQQVASLGRARGDGTGLGLPLTKALVEANRAEFAIQSEPGRGTAVEIVFPPSRVLAS